MPFQCVQAKDLYARDSNLKKEDVEIIQEWLKKQPHLPKLEEIQILMALHSNYYRIEAAKTTIDNYFTVRTLCPDIFKALTPDVLKSTVSVGFIKILPKKTPEGYVILMLKLLDTKTEHFNCVNLINLINMVSELYLHEAGIEEGAVALFEMKGFSLAHLGKLNLTAIKHALYHVQEGLPVRIKGIHIMNAVPLTDKIVALLKPFLKSELYNMIQFHSSNSDTLYKSIPKECLPGDYGGSQPPCSTLNEQNLEKLLDSYDLFNWHDSQLVDESKRTGKPKNVNDVFGVEGTFKKLEID